MYEEFFGMKHTPFTNQIPAMPFFCPPASRKPPAASAAEHQFHRTDRRGRRWKKHDHPQSEKATLPEEDAF